MAIITFACEADAQDMEKTLQDVSIGGRRMSITKPSEGFMEDAK